LHDASFGILSSKHYCAVFITILLTVLYITVFSQQFNLIFQLKMIRSVVTNSKYINHAIEMMGNSEQRKITMVELSLLKELILILTPFEDATKTVEGENVVTISTVCPVIIGLQVT